MSQKLSQDWDTGRSSFSDFDNTSMSGVISFYSGWQIRLTRIISRAIINQNHQHFQNVFIVQFDFEGPSVVGPGSAVVSGGSVGGLRSLTGFKHAEYDSKLSGYHGLCYDKVISDRTRTSPSQMANGVSWRSLSWPEFWINAWTDFTVKGFTKTTIDTDLIHNWIRITIKALSVVLNETIILPIWTVFAVGVTRCTVACRIICHPVAEIDLNLKNLKFSKAWKFTIWAYHVKLATYYPIYWPHRTSIEQILSLDSGWFKTTGNIMEMYSSFKYPASITDHKSLLVTFIFTRILRTSSRPRHFYNLEHRRISDSLKGSYHTLHTKIPKILLYCRLWKSSWFMALFSNQVMSTDHGRDSTVEFTNPWRKFK